MIAAVKVSQRVSAVSLAVEGISNHDRVISAGMNLGELAFDVGDYILENRRARLADPVRNAVKPVAARPRKVRREIVLLLV